MAMLLQLFILATLVTVALAESSPPPDSPNNTTPENNINSSRPLVPSEDTRCRPGTFLRVNATESTEYCSPCPLGHFWAVGDHRSNSCLPCYRPVPSFEAEVMPCTLTSDTVVACRENHFLQEGAPTSRCRPCSSCRDNATDGACSNVCCLQKGNHSLTIDGTTFLLCRGPDGEGGEDDANAWRLAFILGVMVVGLLTVLVCLWRVTIRTRRKPGRASCLRRRSPKYERGNSFTDYL